MPGSFASELRQPGTSATARAEEVRPRGSRSAWPRQSSRPRCLDWPPARPRRLHSELVAGDHATRPPSCRTETELRPPATARPRRFERSAWGTQEFLGREAQGPQSSGRGKRPGGFDPEELFGAAWWLTQFTESRGAADERGILSSGCNDKEEALLLPRRCFVA